MKKFLIIGDSHTISLNNMFLKSKDKYVSRIVDIVPIGVGSIIREMIVSFDDGRVVINPMIEKEIVNKMSGAEVDVILLFGGEIYNKYSTSIDKDEPFDFIMSDRDNLESENYIPFNMVKDAFKIELEQYSKAIKLLSQKLNSKIHIMSGPPPHKSSDLIYETMNRNFGKRKIPFNFIKILDDGVRYKLWEVNQMTLRDIANSNNVNYIDMPSDLFDGIGCLKAEFEHDGVHGNSACAKLILESLIKYES